VREYTQTYEERNIKSEYTQKAGGGGTNYTREFIINLEIVEAENGLKHLKFQLFIQFSI